MISTMIMVILRIITMSTDGVNGGISVLIVILQTG
ncbi:hypothetical protein OROMI_031308 [Orobanche minor]